MSPPAPRFFYDLVDPLSWVMEHELAALETELPVEVERVPFELRPPPEALLDPDAPEWRERWARARSERAGAGLGEPGLVPWSRKAHELVLHAEEHHDPATIREALFRAFLEEGRDIGRVDVLVELAVALGYDLTRTKAVLDVDRHAAGVEALRAEALAMGVQGVPTLAFGDHLLQGFHNRDAVRTFLSPPRQ